jgi:hypothetical protein
MIKKCKYCKEDIEFDKPYQMGAHVGNCSLNVNRKSSKHILNKYILNCQKCNNEYTLELTENNYIKGRYRKNCSSKCSNSRVITTEHKIKTSKSLKDKNSLKRIKTFENKCISCDNYFNTTKKNKKCCSETCLKMCRMMNGTNGGFVSSINKKNYDSDMITYIYALVDEFNNIRYIGKSNDVYNRFKNHLKESKYKRTHKEKWINSMILRGYKPSYIILDECLSSDWILMEEFWIAIVKSWGFNLTNSTMGGEGSDGFKGKKHTQETKDKLRLKTLNYYKSKK